MTVQDLIRSSLRLIGVLAPGRGPGASEMVDALWIANAMLEAWTIDRLKIYQIVRNVYTLTPNVASYQIGPGVAAPGFNAARPIKIENAGLIDLSQPTQPNERPMRVLTEDEWASLRFKTGLFSPLPEDLYNDRGNPVSTLTLWPICSLANQLALYVWQTLGQFASASDTVVFPPGYADAVRYNLAVRFAPEWNRPLRDDVRELARSTLADVQLRNLPERKLACDSALRSITGGGPGSYNWLTNESIR